MHLRNVSECPRDDLPPLSANEKVVWFVRHGQSEANIHTPGRSQLDPSLTDSPLSGKGVLQAQALQSIVRKWNPQIIISSPLTRAMQTCCLAFEREIQPIVAWPLVTEFYPEYPETKGRLVEDLRQDTRLTGLKRFGDVHLDNAVGKWWSCAGDVGRVDTFLNWLHCCPETRIVVVSHWGFLFNVMGAAHYANRGSLALDNCTQLRTVWHPSRTAPQRGLPLPPREYAVWLEPYRARRNILLEELDALVEACTADEKLSSCSFLKKLAGRPHISLTDFLPLGFDAVDLISKILATGGNYLMGNGVMDSGMDPKPDIPPTVRYESWHIPDGTHADNGASAVSCRVTQGKTFYAALEFHDARLQALVDEIGVIPQFRENAAGLKAGVFNVTIMMDDRPDARSFSLDDFKSVLDPEKLPLLCSALGISTTPSLEQAWRTELSSLGWTLCIMYRDPADNAISREPGTAIPLVARP